VSEPGPDAEPTIEQTYFVKGQIGIPWIAPDPDLLSPAQQQMRRIAESIRLITERSLSTGASVAALAEVADDLAVVAEIFDRLEPGKGYEGYAEAATAGFEPGGLFERSPMMGHANPLAPPITVVEVDGHIEATGTFGIAYEGPPGNVHGGFVAAAFDEVLGATQSLGGQPGFTGTLTIKYRSPTPLHTPLRFVSEVTAIEGRKTFTAARLFAGETLCAEAEGIFIAIDPAKYQHLISAREERFGTPPS
jgi:acyl-coenzyme A thioesterase PaaI-like protein